MISRAAWAVLLLCSASHADEPRTRDQVRAKLKAIQLAARESTDGTIQERKALGVLNGYRYLAGVAHDITLHRDLTKRAQAGAALLRKVGKLEHRPKNPGLPDADYKLAFSGTAGSNLSRGLGLPEAVKAWMFDSDAKNIGKLGHRRWALNPRMQFTGFGRQAPYATMYIMDFSRTQVPDYDFICFPARGSMPSDYFGRTWAWSVMPNPAKYRLPADPETLEVEVFRRRGTPGREGFAEQPVELDFAFPLTHWSKTLSTVIFRPKSVSLGTGFTYRVRIAGLSDPKGNAAEIAYIVEFFRL